MWKIKRIISENTCQEESCSHRPLLLVTVIDENNNEKTVVVSGEWFQERSLEIGSEWPDYRDVRIETKDLVLKKASMDDWKDIYHNLWCYPESAKYMLWEVTTSEDAAIERIIRTISFQKYNKYAFFIYEKKNEKAIGFAGMKEIEPGIYEDIGIALGPAYTGKGYGTQILMALVDEARKSGAHRFVATCRKQNTRSHDLMMKCGFSFSHDENRIDPRDGGSYILEFNTLEL